MLEADGVLASRDLALISALLQRAMRLVAPPVEGSNMYTAGALNGVCV